MNYWQVQKELESPKLRTKPLILMRYIIDGI